MGDAVKKLSLASGFRIIPKYSPGHFSADDLTVGPNHRLTPPSAEGRNDFRFRQNFMANLIGVEHGCAPPGKGTRNRAFAAGNAADNA